MGPFFRLQADRIAGNFLQLDSTSGAKFTDTDAEQSWLYLKPEINQTGTANYSALTVDVTETDTGDDNNYLIDLGECTYNHTIQISPPSSWEEDIYLID